MIVAGGDDDADVGFELGGELVVEEGELELVGDEEEEDVGLGGIETKSVAKSTPSFCACSA